MENAIFYSLVVLIIAVPAAVYFRRIRRRDALAATGGQESSEGPRAQHPRIDTLKCIGCGSCVDSCPEGDVLALVGGTAAIINGDRCIGHGLCADACPVGAITMVLAKPGAGADVPRLTAEYETTVPNMFIAGELGGLALIRNAVDQGRACVDTITARLGAMNGRRALHGVYDLCVVGAGPAGISAALRAKQSGLSCITLEQDEVGGTVAKYPRQKLVMTSPVEIPLYGKFRKLEITKEGLIALWDDIFRKTGLEIKTSEKVDRIHKGPDEVFIIETLRGRYLAHFVVLAMGRRGTPRKLDLPGEELPKVMYSLIDASAYTDNEILVVGGGDSAVEAAFGLAHQTGNRVTLSYRQAAFRRIKERNARRIRESGNSVRVLFNSRPLEILERSVILEIGGERREIPNDYVWIFAGGIPPAEFLQASGIALEGVRS